MAAGDWVWGHSLTARSRPCQLDPAPASALKAPPAFAKAAAGLHLHQRQVQVLGKLGNLRGERGVAAQARPAVSLSVHVAGCAAKQPPSPPPDPKAHLWRALPFAHFAGADAQLEGCS